MTIFAAAIDALFTDPNIARDAVYVASGGEPVLVRVVPRRGDDVTEFGNARVWAESARFDLRVSEVAAPRPGDRLELDGTAYLVQGEPMRDAARLVWTLDTRPA